MKKVKEKKVVLLVVVSCLALVLCGCITPKYLIKEYDPPRTIAVLLMDNQTTDLVGARYVRSLFHKYLPTRRYTVIDLTYIDSKLNEVGITYGGQLSLKTPQEIGEIVGAEGVVYGTLKEFKFITTGLYTERKVVASFKLFSSRTGELLWEDEREKKRSNISLTPLAMAETFVGSMTTKLVEGVFRCPLGSESRDVVKTILSTLPKYPKP